MEEEDIEQAGLNFVPCLTWIRRGVAKLIPEKVFFLRTKLYCPLEFLFHLMMPFSSFQVELAKEELEALIGKTKGDLADLNEEDDEEQDEDEKDKDEMEADEKGGDGVEKEEDVAVEKEMNEDEKIAAEYNMDDYDDGA